MSIKIPEDYQVPQPIKETDIAIKEVKDFFERALAYELNLTRVTAPLFVRPESGLNDNLNGVERPVSFGIREQADTQAEIVHSLAKWKRMALHRYGFEVGEGLYTDMNAIRREDRNFDTLKSTVRSVYDALKHTERHMAERYEYIQRILPEQIFFITSQELEDLYPNCTPKEREYNIARAKGAVFIMQIGDVLRSGQKHDGRAPDYDDWKLNGDIIVYYPVLDCALELSSMGIRVDEQSLAEQLKKAGCEERAELPFQRALLAGQLPYTIGGGIGQSRICMFFLRRAHIGEVQASIWPQETMDAARERGIELL